MQRDIPRVIQTLYLSLSSRSGKSEFRNLQPLFPTPVGLIKQLSPVLRATLTQNTIAFLANILYIYTRAYTPKFPERIFFFFFRAYMHCVCVCVSRGNYREGATPLGAHSLSTFLHTEVPTGIHSCVRGSSSTAGRRLALSPPHQKRAKIDLSYTQRERGRVGPLFSAAAATVRTLPKKPLPFSLLSLSRVASSPKEPHSLFLFFVFLLCFFLVPFDFGRGGGGGGPPDRANKSQ